MSSPSFWNTQETPTFSAEQPSDSLQLRFWCEYLGVHPEIRIPPSLIASRTANLSALEPKTDALSEKVKHTIGFRTHRVG